MKSWYKLHQYDGKDNNWKSSNCVKAYSDKQWYLPFYPSNLFSLGLTDPRSVKRGKNCNFPPTVPALHLKAFRCSGTWLFILTWPNVLSESPVFFKNWAASAAPTFPVFPGSTCNNHDRPSESLIMTGTKDEQHIISISQYISIILHWGDIGRTSQWIYLSVEALKCRVSTW